MLNRRMLLVFSLAVATMAAPAAALAQTAPPANDPMALLTRLYAAAGKDNAGGDFHKPKSRAKYLSKAFAALWSKAEAKTPQGDIGPIEFDPVSNSQDPDIKSFAIAIEKQDSGTATLAVTLTESRTRDNPADNIIRYDFVRDGAHWRIDDIRGTVDGKPWSTRRFLTDFLKG
jgi:hypothetical protein